MISFLEDVGFIGHQKNPVIRGAGYRPIDIVHFAKALFKNKKTLREIYSESLRCRSYLSTRVGGKEMPGWSYDENIKLGLVRYNQLCAKKDNLPILFPAKESWQVVCDAKGKNPDKLTPTEMLLFWILVLNRNKKRKMVVHLFEEDTKHSTGCRVERMFAEQFGFPVVIL